MTNNVSITKSMTLINVTNRVVNVTKHITTPCHMDDDVAKRYDKCIRQKIDDVACDMTTDMAEHGRSFVTNIYIVTSFRPN